VLFVAISDLTLRLSAPKSVATSDSLGDPSSRIFSLFFVILFFVCGLVSGNAGGNRGGELLEARSSFLLVLYRAAPAALCSQINQRRLAIRGEAFSEDFHFSVLKEHFESPFKLAGVFFVRAASQFCECLFVIFECCFDQISGGNYPVVLLGPQSRYGDSIAHCCVLGSAWFHRNSVAYRSFFPQILLVWYLLV
jgi:hypothetical protein